MSEIRVSGSVFWFVGLFFVFVLLVGWLVGTLQAQEDVREADISPRSWAWGNVQCHEHSMDGHSVLIYQPRNGAGMAAIHNPGCACQKAKVEK